MNSSRTRKIVYMLSIVVLYVAVLQLTPFMDRQGEEYGLSQKSLGDVDPVSGTAQLVFTGFRGVAVSFLWHEAIHLKRTQRWFEIRPVLESITLLQPNFLKPWTFQSWNMAYNIAAEWESVPDKYYWIHEGIDFMKKSTQINREQQDLLWYCGWLYHNRFGMSDEKLFLREMYRDETDLEFAGSSAGGVNDNFKTAYDWFVSANNAVIDKQERPKNRGITPFMSYPAVSRTYYATFFAQDGEGEGGIFGERSKDAWRTAHQEWLKFGRRGEPGRYAFIHKLEFTQDEWDALTEEEQYWAGHFAKIVNYYYWKRRTEVEATDEMQIAREAYYKANQASEQGDYTTAISQFEKAFPIWRKVIEDDENLRTDYVFIEESQENEEKYLRLLSNLNLKQPEKRPFEGLFPEYEDPMLQMDAAPGANAEGAPKPNADAKKSSEPKPDSKAQTIPGKEAPKPTEAPPAEQPNVGDSAKANNPADKSKASKPADVKPPAEKTKANKQDTKKPAAKVSEPAAPAKKDDQKSKQEPAPKQ